MADFYVTEEKAMAPGIAGDWPLFIAKPDSPHGRLAKIPGLQQRMDGAVEELTLLSNLGSIPEQQRQIIGDVAGVLRSVFSSS